MKTQSLLFNLLKMSKGYKKSFTIRFSVNAVTLLKKLKLEGFIQAYQVIGKTPSKIVVFFKYDNTSSSTLKYFSLISKSERVKVFNKSIKQRNSYMSTILFKPLNSSSNKALSILQ